MKTYLLSLLAIVLLVSCSKDDDTNAIDDTMETKRYPKTVEILSPNTSGELTTMLKYTYGFNADKKITSIEIEGFFGYENIYFNYGPNGLPNEIEVQNNQTTETFELYYTDSRLSGFSTNVQDYDINYNSANNTYAYVKDGFDDSFTLNDMNDIRRYFSISPTGSNMLMEMTFDTTKKGVFYNVDLPLNFYAAIVSDASTLLFASHIPLLAITQTGETALNYQNTYDAEGFITESNTTFGQDQTTVRFEYQEL